MKNIFSVKKKFVLVLKKHIFFILVRKYFFDVMKNSKIFCYLLIISNLIFNFLIAGYFILNLFFNFIF
jgi:hypothetical protein